MQTNPKTIDQEIICARSTREILLTAWRENIQAAAILWRTKHKTRTAREAAYRGALILRERAREDLQSAKNWAAYLRGQA